MNADLQPKTVPVLAVRLVFPGFDEPSGPAVPEVEAGLRRRLSKVSRLALRAAFDCAGDSPLRVVYASRHGELARSTSIIESIVRGEDASPMAFSMSVLNAGVGVLSIARNDLQPSTAISAGPASLSMGLLEAATQFLHDPAQPVLFVFADETVPAIYNQPAAASPPFAVALLLHGEGPGRLSWETGVSSTKDDAVDTFSSVLTDPAGGQWQNSGLRWKWESGGCAIGQ